MNPVQDIPIHLCHFFFFFTRNKSLNQPILKGRTLHKSMNTRRQGSLRPFRSFLSHIANKRSSGGRVAGMITIELLLFLNLLQLLKHQHWLLHCPSSAGRLTHPLGGGGRCMGLVDRELEIFRLWYLVVSFFLYCIFWSPFGTFSVSDHDSISSIRPLAFRKVKKYYSCFSKTNMYSCIFFKNF